MKDVVIVSACRTAIGTYRGSLRGMNSAVIASLSMKEAIARAGIEADVIDDVRFGCCVEYYERVNVARVAALMAGIPDNISAVTVNRLCNSAMEAIVSGMAMIQADMAEVILAGGVEHMSGEPYSVGDTLAGALHTGSYLFPLSDDSPLNLEESPASLFVGKPYNMGHSAEFLAQYMNIPREEMDEVALRSHHNAERATNEGAFREEILPVQVPRENKEPLIFDKDEQFRPGVTLKYLKRFPPAFIPKTGKITAGNSSGVNDGAAAMVIMSAEKAKSLGLKPLAKIRAMGRGACHPSIMGLSPVPAVRDLMDRSGLKLDDFERIELNEAFAAQYLACEKELGLKREITNVNGSGISLGHPVGASGCRLMVTLLYEMRREGKTLGLASLCGGGGLGMACAIETL